jgi:hypothetical protein
MAGNTWKGASTYTIIMDSGAWQFNIFGEGARSYSGAPPAVMEDNGTKANFRHQRDKRHMPIF